MRLHVCCYSEDELVIFACPDPPGAEECIRALKQVRTHLLGAVYGGGKGAGRLGGQESLVCDCWSPGSTTQSAGWLGRRGLYVTAGALVADWVGRRG